MGIRPTSGKRPTSRLYAFFVTLTFYNELTQSTCYELHQSIGFNVIETRTQGGVYSSVYLCSDSLRLKPCNDKKLLAT